MKRLFPCILALAFPGLFFSESKAAPPLPEKIEFNRDVRPILSDNCFYCHGNDPHHRKGRLRLDERESALRKAIQPGKPNQSLLVERILSNDAGEQMPPPDSNKKLTPYQKEILKRWIEQGATYQQHWSYEKPVKAAVPPGQNGVDFLQRRRLAEIGMKLSPIADRRTLIRRLYADLLGLPPKPEEVDAFVNDKSADAYARLVERVLQNPHYGERMAIGWLDVVRFADTIGYHSDNPRNVWPYRDYVIQSFNNNKRFDRFTIEQIAGDLVKDASTETRVGSAFNRLILSTEEGGAQPKDYEQRMLTDRVRAIGTVWLGQTTGCAQCHDHKFDPFTSRDFYSLGAFFADIKEGIIGRREDGMLVVNPSQQAKWEQVQADLATAKKAHDAIQPKLADAEKKWLASLKGDSAAMTELQKTKKVADAIAKDPKKRTKAETQAIHDYFLVKHPNLFAEERKALAQAQKAHDAFASQLPHCLVSTHSDNLRTVRILPRGNWMDETGEIVKPAFPHYLPQPKIEGRPLTRLDLAEWLVSRDNPLTARTVMNRLWKQLFGSGLSKVLDDLGAQGELPRNAPMLDWLACEFMDTGWDMKQMVRTIVMSETYRQVSTANPALRASDPDNREFARQTPFRLDAELVRDQSLAISGLLVRKIGGPSVKPYQPAGYWENLNFPTRTYTADTGESQYRRGMYTWWQRSFLHPSMLAFDAPSREECCAERPRSNIPQQALVLLNDPTYVESARGFASRILTECKDGNEQRIVWAWQQALQRKPDDRELRIMTTLLNERLATYRADAQATDELLSVGLSPLPASLNKAELAAWVHVARVLLNLHETITRS